MSGFASGERASLLISCFWEASTSAREGGRPIRVAVAELGGLVAPSTPFRLAPLGPILLLNADESQPAAMLADDTRTLDRLVEATEQLIKAFGITYFDPHTSSSPSV